MPVRLADLARLRADLVPLYADAWRRSVEGLRRNRWTLAIAPAWLLALSLVGFALAPILPLAFLALLGLAPFAGASLLHFVDATVAGRAARPSELRPSLTRLLLPVLHFEFVLLVALAVIGPLAIVGSRAFEIGIKLAAFVLLGGVPELIYQRHAQGPWPLVVESARMLRRLGPRWLATNLLLGGAFVGFAALCDLLPWERAADWSARVVLVGAAYPALVFRGHVLRLLEPAERP